MDRLQPFQWRYYKSYFDTADGAFRNGQVVATRKGSKTAWRNWSTSVQPLVLDPWLQDTLYQKRLKCLTGLTDFVRSGRFGIVKQVAVGTVSGALSAVGATISLAYE